jgi:hypothetical protein
MTSLLQTLLLDLKRRGNWILGELAAVEKGLPADFNRHRREAFQRVTRAVAWAEHTLRDPDLADPKLEPNFFRDFKRISELIVSIEDTSLLILKRCSPEDRFLTALLEQICREVVYKDSPPLCGALSFQYFQALMETDIIMTPQGQASELLALPDLYHELAHFVVFRERPALEVPVLAIIHKYFADAVRKGRQQGLPQATMDAIGKNSTLWTSLWHVEFACDMVATYWCGPAYGLANLRLSATRGDPYQDSGTHPADDARKTGIECILKLAGEGAAANETDRMWQDLKRLSPSVQPGGYAKRYPVQLLEQVAHCVYEECAGLGFRRFSQHQSGSAIVGGAIAQAWEAFQRDAAAFGAYECSAIQALKSKLATPSKPSP